MELIVRDTKIYAYTGGKTFDPQKPALVFLHGAANDHTVWGLQSRYFANHGYSVLAVDLPGHGRSGGEPLASIGALADWVADLLDVAGVEKAVLAGHSMGSLTALEAAARHPGRIGKIALLGSAVPMAVSEQLLAAAKDKPEKAYRMINQWSNAQGLGGNTVPGAWQPGASLALMRRARAGSLFVDLSNCNDYQTGLEAAAKVQCPALLVIAKRDLMTPPRAAGDLAKALKDVRKAEIDGAGHAMMAEQPDRVLDALRAFLL